MQKKKKKKKSRACRPSRGFYHKRHRLISFDCNFFFLSLSPVTLHFTIFYISLISPPHFSHRHRERESGLRVTLFSFNHYFADYSLRISLVLSLSLSLSLHFDNGEELDWNAWFSEQRFCDPDVWDLVVFSVFFFCFFFWSALDLRLFLVFFVESVCVSEGFLVRC